MELSTPSTSTPLSLPPISRSGTPHSPWTPATRMLSRWTALSNPFTVGNRTVIYKKVQLVQVFLNTPCIFLTKPGLDRANSESSTISPNSCYMSMPLGSTVSLKPLEVSIASESMWNTCSSQWHSTESTWDTCPGLESTSVRKKSDHVDR